MTDRKLTPRVGDRVTVLLTRYGTRTGDVTHIDSRYVFVDIH
jgi:hypothetical protein